MVSLGVFKYDKIEDVIVHSRFDDNQFKITWNNGKCGLWSCKENKPLLHCKYDSITPVIVKDDYMGEQVDFFKVGLTNEEEPTVRYGVFDINRKCFVISCEYWIEPIISLNRVFAFWVTKPDCFKIGVIDTNGVIICPLVFDGHLELQPFDDNTPRQERLFTVKDEDWQGKIQENLFFVLKRQVGYQIYNQRGEAISSSLYSSVRMVDTGRHHHSDYGGWMRRDTLFIVCASNNFGVISDTGKEIVTCEYEAIDYNPQMDVLTMKHGNNYSVLRINHDSLLD